MSTPKLLSKETLTEDRFPMTPEEWRSVLGHVSALEADNAAMRQEATRASAELRHAYRPETRDWNLVARAITILEAVTTPDHPGAALLEELETLRQRQALWEEAANALYGYTEFIGPCAHGRDPWDRCDECGEKNAVAATVGLLTKEREEHQKALTRARNEGLEKAAVAVEQMLGLARRIRDLKEPEE